MDNQRDKRLKKTGVSKFSSNVKKNDKAGHCPVLLHTRLSKNSSFEKLCGLNKPKVFQKMVKNGILGQSGS